MNELNLVISDRVDVTKGRLVMVCRDCGHEWGVNLTSTMRLPVGADKCTVCNHKAELKGIEPTWTPRQ